MSSEQSPAPARVPPQAPAVGALLEDLSKIAVATAGAMLDPMFAACDDHFFDLASRAKSNQEQNRWFESLREIRARKTQVEAEFSRLFEERAREFARRGPTARRAPAPPSARIDTLSLVGEEQADREAVITDMVSRARLEFTDELYQLNERLHVILPQHTEPADSPFDPGALTRCFVQAAEPVDVDLRVRKILYRQFERHVLRALDELYYPLNQRLLGAGILPGLTPLSPRKVRKYDLPDESAKKPAPPPPVSPAPGDAGGIPESDPEMRELAQLLRRLRSGGVRLPMFPEVPDAEAGPPIERDELISLLSDVQVAPAAPGEEQKPLDIRRAIEAIIASRGQLRVGQADEDVINVVGMFFDIILDDRNLPIEIQALVSRLQIPILKVALRDRSFFTDRKHPARLLINEIARTSIGWESSSKDTQDALFIRITELVEEVLRSSPDHTDIFEKCLSDLTSFIERNEQRAAKMERRTSEKALADARTARARDMVRHVLQERLEGRSLPVPITTFLLEDWQQVLQMVFLRAGSDSTEWIEAVQAVDDLVWSAQPHDDEKSRARLERLLPELFLRMEAGLANTQCSPEDARARVEAIRTLHARLRSAGPDAVAEVPVAPLTPAQLEQITPASPDERSWRDMTAVERQKVQYEALMYEYLKRVDELPVGCWFEYDDLRRGVTRRCKFASRIVETQSFIFVNRVGVQVYEKPRKAFAYDLQMGHARPIEDAPLFDRTIERIAANLRKLAGES